MSAAIGRESAAGIPNSAIRVGRDSALKNGGNPAGLGVFNTLQETSLKDGMNQAMKAGSNPKTNGSVPNFFAGAANQEVIALQQQTNSHLAEISGGSSLSDVVGSVDGLKEEFSQLTEALSNFSVEGNINVNINANVSDGESIGESIDKKIKDSVDAAIARSMGNPLPPKV